MSESIKKFLDPTSTILEKFREKVPGTYRHCCNVSSICKSIASDLKMDVDLMEFVGLYHDIGKMNCPEYFSENQQPDKNIHDKMDPFQSYCVITKHVGDGVLFLLQYDIPIEAIKIISQHHGDLLLNQFYNKSKNSEIDKNKFRYKSKKPQSQEASILMIVDSVEAATQSALQSQKDDTSVSEIIESVIEKIIGNLIDDGQIDNMRLGVLKTVKNSLKRELGSYHHKRVSYENNDDMTIGQIKNEEL